MQNKKVSLGYDSPVRGKTNNFNLRLRDTTRILTIALTCVLVGATIAQAARLDARRLTCEEAQDIVHERGAIVMTLSRYTYDRIVSNRSYCATHEYARDIFTETLDVERCRIGKQCIIGDDVLDRK